MHSRLGDAAQLPEGAAVARQGVRADRALQGRAGRCASDQPQRGQDSRHRGKADLHTCMLIRYPIDVGECSRHMSPRALRKLVLLMLHTLTLSAAGGSRGLLGTTLRLALGDLESVMHEILLTPDQLLALACPIVLHILGGVVQRA